MAEILFSARLFNVALPVLSYSGTFTPVACWFLPTLTQGDINTTVLIKSHDSGQKKLPEIDELDV